MSTVSFNRGVPVKRKRNGHTSKNRDTEKLSGIEIRDADSESDSDVSDTVECWKFWKESEKPPKIPISDYTSPPAYGQGAIYLFMIIGIGIFIYFVNSYNARQLERIKEEYGMDMKPPVPELWWQHALYHHVFVRSFKDSDNDGIGDLRGVKNSLQYFLYLGVDAVILSHILQSPFTDFGRDASDFLNIDAVYGTLQEFEELVRLFHDNKIKVLLEVNPNHSSRKHAYFEASRRLQTPYEDFYVWHPGTVFPNDTRAPPNNWLSRYGGSAWTFDPVRGEYYYHHYQATMPDLNYRNELVIKQLKEMLEFWFERGIDGYFMDGAHLFYEVDDLKLDEPESEAAGVLPGEYDYLNHVYTVGQHEIHDLTIALRDWIDSASVELDRQLALLLHVEDPRSETIIKYYDTGSHAAVSRALLAVDGATGGRDLYDIIDAYKSLLPPEKMPIWMLSHPDSTLSVSRVGPRYQNVYNMLLQLLPGAAITFMGEELAASPLPTSALPTDMYKTRRQQQFASGLAPMPWNRFNHGGFSKTDPWLPARPDFNTNNAEIQMQDGQRVASPAQTYGKLARLRKEMSFMLGETQYAYVDDHLYSFMRFAKNSAPYLVIANIGSASVTADLTLTAGVQYGKVMIYVTPVVPGAAEKGADGGEVSRAAVAPSEWRKAFKEDQTIDLHAVTLRPGEGLVLMLLLEVVMDMDMYG